MRTLEYTKGRNTPVVDWDIGEVMAHAQDMANSSCSTMFVYRDKNDPAFHAIVPMNSHDEEDPVFNAWVLVASVNDLGQVIQYNGGPIGWAPPKSADDLDVWDPMGRHA